MKDEIKYELQSFDDCTDDWYSMDMFWSKKEVKNAVRDCKYFDKQQGLKIKYRIVKLTIKKEVVK